MQLIICQLFKSSKLFKSSSCLLLVLYRSAIDFYISTLYPATLLNALVLIMLFIVTIIVVLIKINRIIKNVI